MHHWTTWHITFGTYGARLHGGERPTVDREHNQPGEPFVERNERREQFERDLMTAAAVLLDEAQRRCVESAIPAICARGGWRLREWAAGREGDHVHVLLDAPAEVHGKVIRELIKRWLTQALDREWRCPASGRWWAEGGSTKVVKDESHLHACTPYIRKQRTTRG